MVDVTVKRVDELESYQGPGGPPGQFLYAAKSLGVGAWGMNVLRLPPRWSGYPDHDHAKDGQEEVYVVMLGDATLQAGGDTWHLVPGMLPIPVGNALVVQCVLSIEDEEAHASHFWIRDAASKGVRPVQKYLDRLGEIRQLQEFIVERARAEGVPVIENTGVEETVGAVIELVLGTAAEQLERV